MAKKTATRKKTTKPTAKPLPFEKGGFYLDTKDRVFLCTSAKRTKTPDGHETVMMQPAAAGTPTGEPGEEYTDTFVRRLTKAEVQELRDADQREREALAETEATAGGTEPQPAKGKRTRKPKEPKADGKMSGLDAAAKVLAEAGEPLQCKTMVEQMLAKGYWTTGGKTPAATLDSAILREINTKGADSRFNKTDRGHFALNG